MPVIPADPTEPARAAAQVRFGHLLYVGQDADSATPLPAGQCRNPVLSGCWPDPSVCRVGDDYVLATSTFATFPGIALHHSRDLVHWRLIGHALTRPEALPLDGLGVSRGLFAPDISHHAGRWYLVCTLVGGRGNFVLTADQPQGPWSDPVWLDVDGIDPALFFDHDGQAWLLNNGPPPGQPLYDGHRAIWLQAFDTTHLALTGPRHLLVDGGVDIRQQPVWIEGPHLYRHDGWYLLSAAEGGTSLGHSQVVLRSRQVTGPYEPWAGNPVLSQRTLDHRVPGAVACTGHADLVTGPDGRWWALFLGCRPLPAGHWLLGRETFLLPVQWTGDGWPLILPAGQRVPLRLAAPAVASADQAPAPAASWHIDFSQQTPADDPAFIGLRRPHGEHWTADAQGLLLAAGTDPLAGRGRPAVVLRRVQHHRFTLQTRIAVPQAPGVQGGLVLFQSEAQHDLLLVGRGADGRGVELQLARCDGGRERLLARVPLPDALTALHLRVQADALSLRCDWAAAPAGPVGLAEASPAADWHPVAQGLSHAPLSVQAAGDGRHFTGLLAGLHARRLAGPVA